MPTVSRVLSSLFLVAVMISSVSAQQQPGTTPSMRIPLITAAESGENIRFVATPRVCEIRVEVLDADGVVLFDSSWQGGNVFDWPAASAAPTAGTYRCMVQARGLDGRIISQTTTLVSDGGIVSIQPQSGDEISVVSPESAPPKITLLAHDGTNGSIVTTSGDLSFRFGNILLGKDAEKMHLTSDGKLGIGTDKPQAPLDVNGLIRTSKGILFPDGTILTTASGIVASGPGDGGSVMRQHPSAPTTANAQNRAADVRQRVLLLNPPAGSVPRLTPRTNFAPAYQFVVGSSGVSVGTTDPSYRLDVTGVVNSGTEYDLAGSRLLYGDSSNLFVGYSAGPSTSGSDNAFFGTNAGLSNTTGSNNALFGFDAGFVNNGSSNAMFGYEAGAQNTTGSYNSYFGFHTAQSDTYGTYNTALGYRADIVDGLFYGTAIGAFAQAAQPNTVILGSITGVNGATTTASTGIATQSPNQNLGVGGGITIDENSQNNGTDTTNTVLAFGTNGPTGMSGEAIGSQRTSSGGNQYGLDFYTLYTKRMSISNSGNVQIFGTLSKGGGSFKIDDPIDPTNKYLYHSFVESPDMKNIYDGIATLDENGEAVVQLPNWFEALNGDFRYQLTCIGAYAQVYIAQEVSNNQFEIAGGKPGMRVSWQVTGIRHDAFANAHRIPVEEEKPPSERGTYLYPKEAAENPDDHQ